MTDNTQYTISGETLRDLTISTTHDRFKDSQIETSTTPDHVDLEVVNVRVSFRGGFRTAGSMQLHIENGSIRIAEFKIANAVRSVGLSRFMLGIVYGIGVWADANEVWGLIDYSRLTEEALINAGYPPSNFIIADETNSMFFQAKLSQIDFNNQDFYIVD